MKYLLAPPSLDDLIRLLKAWRLWVLAGFLGALLGLLAYQLIPPPYRATATVNVDFNLEQAWPQDTDRQQFYYLERESRKLEEIAWSDAVLSPLAGQFSLPLSGLRAGILHLSQPAEAGWHFYADHPDSQVAASLASAWAQSFTFAVRAGVDSGAINQFVTLDATQVEQPPLTRSTPLALYMITASLTLFTLLVLLVLFVKPAPR